MERKGNCVVCQAILNRQNLPTLGSRHETRVQCEHCGVYLCVASTRDCFKKYHTHNNLTTVVDWCSFNFYHLTSFTLSLLNMCVCTTVVLYLCVFVSPCVLFCVMLIFFCPMRGYTASICVTMCAFLCYANFFLFHARVHGKYLSPCVFFWVMLIFFGPMRGYTASICVTMCAFLCYANFFFFHARVHGKYLCHVLFCVMLIFFFPCEGTRCNCEYLCHHVCFCVILYIA